MPAKKKTARKKAAPRQQKPTYVCVPCGTEIVISKKGVGANMLMCCGRVMKRKAR